MDLILILIIITFSYQLVRKGQQTRNWSKKKVHFLFGLLNSFGLFFGLLFLEILFYSLAQVEIGFLTGLALVALIYGLIMFSLSFIKYSNSHKEKKKNIFDEDFIPQRDISILDKGKEIIKMEVITIIIVLLPLLAIFITLYFL